MCHPQSSTKNGGKKRAAVFINGLMDGLAGEITPESSTTVNNKRQEIAPSSPKRDHASQIVNDGEQGDLADLSYLVAEISSHRRREKKCDKSSYARSHRRAEKEGFVALPW